MSEDVPHVKRKSPDEDGDIDEIAQRILTELEKASPENFSQARYAKKILRLSDLNNTKNILQEMDRDQSGPDCIIEKKAIIKALLLSTWLQRLYFIIRSAFMAVLAMVLTFLFVSFFGEIGVVLAVILGLLIFIAGLTVTRLFDQQTVGLTKYIVGILARHKKLRKFIMNHF